MPINREFDPEELNKAIEAERNRLTSAAHTSSPLQPQNVNQAPNPNTQPRLTQSRRTSRRDFLITAGALGAGAIAVGYALLNQPRREAVPSPKPGPTEAPRVSASPSSISTGLLTEKIYLVYRLISMDNKADVALTTIDVLQNNLLRFNVLTSKKTADAYIKCDSNNNDQDVYLTFDRSRVTPLETTCTNRRGQQILGWGLNGNNASLYSWAIFRRGDVDLSQDLSFNWYGLGRVDDINLNNPKIKPPISVPTLKPNQTLNIDQVWAMLNPELQYYWGSDWKKVNSQLNQFMKGYAPYSSARPENNPPSFKTAQEKNIVAKYEYINQIFSTQPSEAKAQFVEGQRTVPNFERRYWEKVEESLGQSWGRDWIASERILRGYLAINSQSMPAKQKLAVVLFQRSNQLSGAGSCEEANKVFDQISDLQVGHISGIFRPQCSPRSTIYSK